MPAKIQVVDPATEEVLAEVPNHGPQDVNRAVERSRRAFEKWRWAPAHERAELLHAVAQGIRAQARELSKILTQEGGKPLRENVDEMGWSASCFDYYAELQRNRRGRVIPSIEPSQLSMVLKEPYGVVAAIVPWNYPILLMSWKVAPALAAGNTVIIKPAEQTPLSTLKFKDIFDCFPEGVVQILTGEGDVTGEALVRHPHVSVVAFTGSLEVGKHVAKICAEQVKKVHLELGGKDAFVVCEDSDLEIASRAVAWAAFLNAGQVCTSAERIYVAESIVKKFTERLVDFTKNLRLGPGLDPQTDIGPMIGSQYRQKVESHVQEAVKKGARLLA
ncbi:MAG: aldehyde dehydrogenase, partial [Elusimicrobia bacterium]|nr:aldehyde dehydrogenase [Elusimicrobiota bacterium]